MSQTITRRHLIAAALAAPFLAGRAAFALPSRALEEAGSHGQLRAIAIWSGGAEVAARGYGEFDPEAPVNIKSASKSVLSALAGIAIEKGVIESADQKIATLLEDRFPAKPDPRLYEITLGHLLSMKSGLTPQSGKNYAAWVSSPDWVRAALAAPFIARPGARMAYSTASTHLASAMLTAASGRPMMQLARDWLGGVPGFRITSWARDPQGIYIGGNEMAMSTRSLMAFGAIYAAQGYAGGRQVLPLDWIKQSWVRRGTSPMTHKGYGYGWFLDEFAGRPVNFGWGYGGQMIYVAPATPDHAPVALAMTSDPSLPSGPNGYRDQLHEIATRLLEML
ncbi:serine hydrolase domain-containing protein [Paracoccus aminophilus]|nr:serine hydrolase [Paracoccus aminophilus]